MKIYRLPQPLTALMAAVFLASPATAATYTQDFTGIADGTTDLGDGTVFAGTAKVVGEELQLTENDVAGGFSSFSIPGLPQSSLGWTMTFDLTISDGPGANEPADGMSFNYGNASLGELGSAEEGMAAAASVTENISFEIDTWMNLDAEQGVNIAEKVGGVDTDLAFTNGSILADGTSVSGTVEMTYDPLAGLSFSTTGLLTNAAFTDVATTFDGDDAYTFIFSGRVGGANETKLIDNIVLTTVDGDDTDGDGLPDSYERNIVGDDDLTILGGPGNDAETHDADGDGLFDFDEYDQFRTNPILADTDADGYDDGAEDNSGAWTSVTETGSDPRNPDTDGDGLLDGVENPDLPYDPDNAEDQPGTDPNLVDSDGDQAPDGTELAQGTDPTDDTDTPALWIVRNATSGTALNTVADVRALFAPGGNILAETTTGHGVINFRENANGPFQPQDAFPVIGVQDTDTNDYAILATGPINITEAGVYTFGFNSDDGGGIWIDGQPVVVFDANRGSGTSLGAVSLGIGVHDVEFLYWERGGGAQVQLFVANEIGDRTGLGIDNATVVANYHLLETSSFDPTDTDGDGLPDAYEESFFPGDLTKLGAGDFDGDTLSDTDEFAAGTDPTEKDTDMDGLDDNVEDGGGTYVSATMTGTSPLNPDTDRDGLGDGVENDSGVFVDVDQPGTDPNDPDTDGDGVDDGTEAEAGFNPLDPNSGPPVPILVGVGTGALLGGDLTDPENDGDPENDINYNAVFTSSEEPGFGGGEFAFNVFDNTLGPGNDKWCCGASFPLWVDATFEEEIELTHFTIASANDVPNRDPRVWEIQGTNDGVNFDTIFRQDEPAASIWTQRFEIFRFDAGRHFPTPGAYSTIRFVCFQTGATGGAFYQVGELEYFGVPGNQIPLQMTEVLYDEDNDEFTLTWTSKPDRTYGLFWSGDAIDWGADINDSIASEGEMTTFGPFENPSPGAREIFFRAEEIE